MTTPTTPHELAHVLLMDHGDADGFAVMSFYSRSDEFDHLGYFEERLAYLKGKAQATQRRARWAKDNPAKQALHEAKTGLTRARKRLVEWERKLDQVKALVASKDGSVAYLVAVATQREAAIQAEVDRYRASVERRAALVATMEAALGKPEGTPASP